MNLIGKSTLNVLGLLACSNENILGIRIREKLKLLQYKRPKVC